jgi:hypothetical protein
MADHTLESSHIDPKFGELTFAQQGWIIEYKEVEDLGKSKNRLHTGPKNAYTNKLVCPKLKLYSN